jgi:hypothetical protein
MQNSQPQEEYKVQAPTEQVTILQALRQQHNEARKQKFKNLIATAF